MENDPFSEPNIVSYQKVPPSKRFKRLVRKMDLYALPITFRYKSEKKFYTNIGAFTSICLIITMLCILGINCISMIGRQEIYTTSIVDFSSDRADLGSPANMTFGARIVVALEGKTAVIKDRLDIKFVQRSKIWNQVSSEYTEIDTYIEAIPCLESQFFANLSDESQFSSISSGQIERTSMQDYWCPNASLGNSFVGGMSYDTQFNVSSLEIWPCQNSTAYGYTCESQDEIDDVIKHLSVEFMYLNQNYKSNGTIPLQGFLETQPDTGILANVYQKVLIFMSRNQVYRQDNLYDSSYAKDDPLNWFEQKQISFSKYSNSDYSKPYVEYQFREYQLYDQYTRSYLNIFDVLSDLGGTYSSLSVLGAAVTSMFTYNLMMSSLIDKLYFFSPSFSEEKKPDDDKSDGEDPEPDQQSNIPKIQKLDKNSDDSSDSDPNDNKAEPNYNDEEKGIKTHKQLSLLKQQHARYVLEKNSGKKEMIEEMTQSAAMKKARFDFTTKGILRMYVCCGLLKSRASLRKDKKGRNLLYYYKGLDKLNTEADIGYIIQQIRVMRNFLKTVLLKDQRVLLDLCNKTHINSEEEKPPAAEYNEIINRKLLLQKYVENLIQKDLSRQDVQLLEVTGNKKIIDLINQFSEHNKKNDKLNKAGTKGNSAEQVFMHRARDEMLKRSQAQSEWEKRAMQQLKTEQMLEQLDPSSSDGCNDEQQAYNIILKDDQKSKLKELSNDKKKDSEEKAKNSNLYLKHNRTVQPTSKQVQFNESSIIDSRYKPSTFAQYEGRKSKSHRKHKQQDQSEMLVQDDSMFYKDQPSYHMSSTHGDHSVQYDPLFSPYDDTRKNNDLQFNESLLQQQTLNEKSKRKKHKGNSNYTLQQIEESEMDKSASRKQSRGSRYSNRKGDKSNDISMGMNTTKCKMYDCSD